MSDLSLRILKDHGDGEVHIRVIADFTIWTRKGNDAIDPEAVKEAFRQTMMRFAI